MADTAAHSPLHINRNQEIEEMFHKELYDLQKSGTLTDFTLRAGKHSIPCHKIVLIASSPYFRAMMNSDMTETVTNEATLKNINFGILDALVQYFYLGCIVVPIEYADVKGLVEAADFLHLEKLKEHCQDYLINELNNNNCLGLYKVGMMFRLKILVDKAKMIMRKKFNRVRESEEFMELTFAEVVDYISDEHLNVSRVDSLLDACKDWVMADIATRKKHFKDLLKHLKIADASTELIAHFIKQNRDLIDQEIKMMFYHSAFPQKNALQTNNTNCILLSGGYIEGNPILTKTNSQVKICRMDDFIWKDISVVPNAADNKGKSICQLQDGLMVTGGELQDGSGYSKEAFLYIIKYNAWSKISSMNKGRSCHGSVGFANSAIVFGGNHDTGNACDVDLFNEVHQKWIPAAEMLNKAGVYPIYCYTQSFLYVITNTCANNMTIKGDNGITMQKYDMVKDKWTIECYLPKSITNTAGCSAVWFDDDVFLVGGCNKNCYLFTKYSTATKTWTKLNMPHDIHMYSAPIIVDKKILLLGGTFDGALKCPTNNVCEYDIANDELLAIQRKCPFGVYMASAFYFQMHQDILDSL